MSSVAPASGPTVTVILSTWNGAAWLPELLASLEAQTLRPARLLLRDDGSSDQSVALVRSWAARSGIGLHEVHGPPLGAAGSFLAAISAAPPSDVTMLADQDDVWLPAKIERAARTLGQAEDGVPTLYAARLRVVDSSLSPLSLTPVPAELGISSIAYESVLTGCTMAWNQSLGELLRMRPDVPVPMHDWWIALVASGTGRILFDPEPSILYRQHGSNVVGASRRGLAGLIARFRTLQNARPRIRSDQLGALLRLHGAQLSPEALALARQLVESRAGILSRTAAAFRVPIRRQSPLNGLTTRAAILADRF